jgi:hypothetical protein
LTGNLYGKRLEVKKESKTGIKNRFPAWEEEDSVSQRRKYSIPPIPVSLRSWYGVWEVAYARLIGFTSVARWGIGDYILKRNDEQRRFKNVRDQRKRIADQSA